MAVKNDPTAYETRLTHTQLILIGGRRTREGKPAPAEVQSNADNTRALGYKQKVVRVAKEIGRGGGVDIRKKRHKTKATSLGTK